MNPKVEEIRGSLIREIASRRSATSVDLGLGEPALMPEPLHLERAMAYVRERGLRYTPNAGEAELREAIARQYNYPNLNAAENVCVTTGSQEATYAVLKTLLDPSRDELLVVDPAFPSYAKMAKLEGVPVRHVEMSEDDGFAFDAQRILAAVGPCTRVVVICSPCNPTGRVMREPAVRALSEALLARAGEPVWVLHDEIYREQTFVEDAGYFARVYPYTVVTNSLSKSNALTGLRLGWALAPASLLASVVKVHAWLTSCTDTFAQRVALDIFTNGALREHSAWYAGQQREVVRALVESGLPHLPVDGSFYACIRLPDRMRSLDAAIALADRFDTIAIPGIAFGESFEGWLRLSWVSPMESVREGLRRIVTFVNEGARDAVGQASA